MISNRGRYALRVMIDLTQQKTGGYIPLKEIAARQEISEKYLESILKLLVKGKILTGLRGKGGGYRLTRAPEEYTVADILELTEETARLLAPALAELLPEDSGIRRFAGDYRLCGVMENDQEFYRWLFQCEPPLPAEDLPEDTSLRRKAKVYLAAGGKIGAARGALARQ